MPTGSRRFDLHRVFSRLLDGSVLVLLTVLGVLAVEYLMRPFYSLPTVLRDPQVRFEYSRDFGWVMVPDDGANTFDRAAPIGPNGLRAMAAPVGSAGRASAARERWLLLGGGSAFGVGVDAEETFLSLAARMRGRPVETINGGCEGYDLHQSVRYFERNAFRLSPDVLIVMFEPEDLEPYGGSDSLFTPERFQRLAPHLNRSPNRTNAWEKVRDRSRILSFLYGRVRDFLRLVRRTPAAPAPESAAVRPIDVLVGRETEAVERAFRDVEEKLKTLSGAASRSGIRVCVVALPFPDQIRRAYPRARYQSRLAEICRGLGFQFVDPLPELDQARDRRERIYLPRLPFLAPPGHRAVARALVTGLTAVAQEPEARPESPTGGG